MSTITKFTDKKSAVTLPKTTVVKSENVIDFSLTPCLSGDVVTALKIPAGSLVFKVGIDVLTAEAGTHIVGDQVDPNGYFTALSTATTGVSLADGADKDGKFYAVDDTIDFTLAAAMDSGKCNIFCIYAQIENT